MRILVVAAEGRGGVACAVDALLPHLPHARRVGTRPAGGAAWAVLADDADIVWLHPSLRPRALGRDLMFGALARARGRAVAVQLHGWDAAFAERIGPHFAAAARRVAAWGALTELQARTLAGWGVPDRAIHRVANAYRPEVVPDALTPTDPPTVLFVGRLDDDKGALLLVEALQELPGVRLRLAGEGPARAALVHAALRWRVHDRVELCGWLGPAALRRAYAEASVLALPSADEAAPLVVIEALAAGVPVVGTAVGEVPRLIGGAGRVVLRDPSAIAAALGAVLASPPDMAEARARIRTTSAPEAVAARWRAVFAEIV